MNCEQKQTEWHGERLLVCCHNGRSWQATTIRSRPCIPHGTPPQNTYTHNNTHLRKARSEQDYLKQLSHALKKQIHMRPLQDIDMMDHAIDFDRNNEVGVGHRLK